MKTNFETRKIFTISWITPSGKNYEDKIPMTFDEYQKWINDLKEKKKRGLNEN